MARISQKQLAKAVGRACNASTFAQDAPGDAKATGETPEATGAVLERQEGLLVLELPWPPSVNKYWRQFEGRAIISREGRAYRKQVETLLLLGKLQPLTGRLVVEIMAYPPDNRQRDLDNILKAGLDSMQHGGAYINDGQIDDLRIIRGPVDEGRIVVRIREAK
jgi:crossover junction endodeoxyribonuclease RusA